MSTVQLVLQWVAILALTHLLRVCLADATTSLHSPEEGAAL